jgi:hypothetical protein
VNRRGRGSDELLKRGMRWGWSWQSGEKWTYYGLSSTVHVGFGCVRMWIMSKLCVISFHSLGMKKYCTTVWFKEKHLPSHTPSLKEHYYPMERAHSFLRKLCRFLRVSWRCFHT